MLGWWTVVTTETLEQRKQATGNSKEMTLATWDAGLGSMDWILNLCKAGKATQHSSGGYPNRFTALASELVPLLEKGIADNPGVRFGGDTPTGWKGSITVHHERIAACTPQQMLTVEVWDQS